MLSTTIKRTIATTLSGAAIAGTVGVPAASAMPIDSAGASEAGDAQILAPPPRSSPPAAVETAPVAATVADPLAPERYYMSYEPLPTAEERYYSSYGDPAPLPRDDPDEAYWLAIALSIAGALSIVAVSATQAKRIRVRRRTARPAV